MVQVIKIEQDGFCYGCKYRGKVEGSAHSNCNNPQVKKLIARSSELKQFLVDLLARNQIDNQYLYPMEITVTKETMDTYTPIANGWFNFPFNFDPGWIDHCNGFEKDE